MNKGSLSWAITSFRVVALPFLVYSFNQEITALTFPLFLFAAFSDFLDGYIAKKYETTSQLGSYFDVTADFAFVLVMFVVFVSYGLYSFWIVVLICLVFGQFILSSLYFKRTSYDPIGKYYGSLMFGGIGLTLLFSEPAVHTIVTLGVIVSTVTTLVSRAWYFVRSQKRK